MLSCDRLKSNAYRVLGLPANSTSAQSADAAAALRGSGALGALTPEFDCFGEIMRSEAAIRLALEALNTPSERMQHRLLWFQGPVWFENEQRAGPRPRLEPWQTAHESALRVLIAAYLFGDLSKMITALHGWHAFLANADYWDQLGRCEALAKFEPPADEGQLHALRENAMALAAEPLALAARNACAQQEHVPFQACLAALRQLDETGPWAAACREDLLLSFRHRLARACTTLEETYRTRIIRQKEAAAWNRRVCAAELHYFRRYIEPAGKDLNAVFADAEHEAQAVRRQIAELLHLIALDHNWADEEATADALIDEALRLALGMEPLIARQQNHPERLDTRPESDSDAPEEGSSPGSFVPRPNSGIESFPQKLPLFASERWRAGAALTVLAVLIVACLVGPDTSSVAAGRTRSVAPAGWVNGTHQRPVSPLPAQAIAKLGSDSKPKVAGAGTDAVTFKLRVLLMQIHAEERTAQQIERQLYPPHREKEATKGLAVPSGPESAQPTM